MKKKHKTIKLLYIGYIFIGITLIMYPIIGKQFNKSVESEVIGEYKDKVYSSKEDEIKKEKEIYNQYNNEIKYNQKKVQISREKLLGYIEIKKIKIKLPIYEGTSDNILSKGIGHIENTGIPQKGQDYHCILVGHSGLTTKKMFDDLNKLKINNIFSVTILNECFEYKIYEIKKVLPNETNELNFKNNQQLVTLVTCTPKLINSHRLLIKAKCVNIKNNI